MNRFFEPLEGRTLFSAANAIVVPAIAAVNSDINELKSDYNVDAAGYKSFYKTVAADVKALGRNKTNSLDLAKVAKSGTIAFATDAKALARLAATTKLDLVRVEVDNKAALKKPTVANTSRLTGAVTALQTAVTADEGTFNTDVGNGYIQVEAAANVVVADNLTDAQLQTDINAFNANEPIAVATISSDIDKINTDVTTLANDVS